MKKTVIMVILMALAYYSPQPGLAQYSTGAYSEVGASDTSVERVSDWLATLGKTEEEKILIKSRRRVARKIKKAQASIARKKKEIERIKSQQ
ncbi:MAG TPA: hypothetical protein PKV41_02555 [Candidatus Omnitrophota bacterium]|nr:hypothetical protein [Candidatus Omnitrophota bacterium]